MAEVLFRAKLTRLDTPTPWGFRLQGGVEYNKPLTLLKVVPESLAAKGGLHPGDIVVKLAGRSADDMTHKDAQDAIISAGNALEIIVERAEVTITAPSSVASCSVGSATSKTTVAKSCSDTTVTDSKQGLKSSPVEACPKNAPQSTSAQASQNEVQQSSVAESPKTSSGDSEKSNETPKPEQDVPNEKPKEVHKKKVAQKEVGKSASKESCPARTKEASQSPPEDSPASHDEHTSASKGSSQARTNESSQARTKEASQSPPEDSSHPSPQDEHTSASKGSKESSQARTTKEASQSPPEDSSQPASHDEHTSASKGSKESSQARTTKEASQSPPEDSSQPASQGEQQSASTETPNKLPKSAASDVSTSLPLSTETATPASTEVKPANDTKQESSNKTQGAASSDKICDKKVRSELGKDIRVVNDVNKTKKSAKEKTKSDPSSKPLNLQEEKHIEPETSHPATNNKRVKTSDESTVATEENLSNVKHKPSDISDSIGQKTPSQVSDKKEISDPVNGICDKLNEGSAAPTTKTPSPLENGVEDTVKETATDPPSDSTPVAGIETPPLDSTPVAGIETPCATPVVNDVCDGAQSQTDTSVEDNLPNKLLEKPPEIPVEKLPDKPPDKASSSAASREASDKVQDKSLDVIHAVSTVEAPGTQQTSSSSDSAGVESSDKDSTKAVSAGEDLTDKSTTSVSSENTAKEAKPSQPAVSSKSNDSTLASPSVLTPTETPHIPTESPSFASSETVSGCEADPAAVPKLPVLTASSNSSDVSPSSVINQFQSAHPAPASQSVPPDAQPLPEESSSKQPQDESAPNTATLVQPQNTPHIPNSATSDTHQAFKTCEPDTVAMVITEVPKITIQVSPVPKPDHHQPEVQAPAKDAKAKGSNENPKQQQSTQVKDASTDQAVSKPVTESAKKQPEARQTKAPIEEIMIAPKPAIQIMSSAEHKEVLKVDTSSEAAAGQVEVKNSPSQGSPAVSHEVKDFSKTAPWRVHKQATPLAVTTTASPTPTSTSPQSTSIAPHVPPTSTAQTKPSEAEFDMSQSADLSSMHPWRKTRQEHIMSHSLDERQLTAAADRVTPVIITTTITTTTTTSTTATATTPTSKAAAKPRFYLTTDITGRLVQPLVKPATTAEVKVSPSKPQSSLTYVGKRIESPPVGSPVTAGAQFFKDSRPSPMPVPGRDVPPPSERSNIIPPPQTTLPSTSEPISMPNPPPTSDSNLPQTDQTEEIRFQVAAPDLVDIPMPAVKEMVENLNKRLEAIAVQHPKIVAEPTTSQELGLNYFRRSDDQTYAFVPGFQEYGEQEIIIDTPPNPNFAGSTLDEIKESLFGPQGYHPGYELIEIPNTPVSHRRRYSLPGGSVSQRQRRVHFAEPLESSVIEIEPRKQQRLLERLERRRCLQEDEGSMSDMEDYSSASLLSAKLDRIERENALSTASFQRHRNAKQRAQSISGDNAQAKPAETFREKVINFESLGPKHENVVLSSLKPTSRDYVLAPGRSGPRGISLSIGPNKAGSISLSLVSQRGTGQPSQVALSVPSTEGHFTYTISPRSASVEPYSIKYSLPAHVISEAVQTISAEHAKASSLDSARTIHIQYPPKEAVPTIQTQLMNSCSSSPLTPPQQVMRQLAGRPGIRSPTNYSNTLQIDTSSRLQHRSPSPPHPSLSPNVHPDRSRLSPRLVHPQPRLPETGSVEYQAHRSTSPNQAVTLVGQPGLKVRQPSPTNPMAYQRSTSPQGMPQYGPGGPHLGQSGRQQLVAPSISHPQASSPQPGSPYQSSSPRNLSPVHFQQHPQPVQLQSTPYQLAPGQHGKITLTVPQPSQPQLVPVGRRVPVVMTQQPVLQPAGMGRTSPQTQQVNIRLPGQTIQRPVGLAPRGLPLQQPQQQPQLHLQPQQQPQPHFQPQQQPRMALKEVPVQLRPGMSAQQRPVTVAMTGALTPAAMAAIPQHLLQEMPTSGPVTPGVFALFDKSFRQKFLQWANQGPGDLQESETYKLVHEMDEEAEEL